MQKMTVTKNVWSDFTYSGNCEVYKLKLVYGLLKGFFIIPLLCSIPDATRNDYFWLVYVGYVAEWYT